MPLFIDINKSITVSVPAAEEPVSLLEAKNQSNVEHDLDNALINRNIVTARQKAESAQSRQLITATLLLTLDAFPSWEIVLERPPIQSVASVAYIDLDGDPQTVDPSLYTLDSRSTPGRLTPAYNQSWPSTRHVDNAVTVTFVAGYGVASAVPAVTKTGILMLAAHLYKEREESTDQALQTVPMGVREMFAVGKWGAYS